MSLLNDAYAHLTNHDLSLLLADCEILHVIPRQRRFENVNVPFKLQLNKLIQERLQALVPAEVVTAPALLTKEEALALIVAIGSLEDLSDAYLADLLAQSAPYSGGGDVLSVIDDMKAKIVAAILAAQPLVPTVIAPILPAAAILLPTDEMLTAQYDGVSTLGDLATLLSTGVSDGVGTSVLAMFGRITTAIAPTVVAPEAAPVEAALVPTPVYAPADVVTPVAPVDAAPAEVVELPVEGAVLPVEPAAPVDTAVQEADPVAPAVEAAPLVEVLVDAAADAQVPDGVVAPVAEWIIAPVDTVPPVIDAVALVAPAEVPVDAAPVAEAAPVDITAQPVDVPAEPTAEVLPVVETPVDAVAAADAAAVTAEATADAANAAASAADDAADVADASVVQPVAQ